MSANADTNKPRNPHPEIGAPVIDLDLEARIVLAEQAVITRDERILRRADDIFRRVKRSTKRHAGAGAAVGIGAMALAWWIRRRQAAAAPPPSPSAHAPADGEHLVRDAGLSLAGLLPLVWPIMPRGIRRNVTPGMASTVVTFVSPLIGRLFRRKPKGPAFE